MTPFQWDAYVLFKAAGIAWFSFACFRNLSQYKLSVAVRAIFIAFIVLSGFFGSKLWYLIQHLFGNEPFDFENLGEAWSLAGSVLYGWILGGSAAVWAGAAILDLRPRRLLDAFLPQMLIAQILNRFGCFAAGCCWGSGPCELPWAVLNENAGGMRVHPVQLYEALFDVLLLAFIWAKGRRKREGWTLETYFLGYASGRFILEFWRGDNGAALAGLTVPQIASLLIIVFVLLTKLITSSFIPHPGKKHLNP